MASANADRRDRQAIGADERDAGEGLRHLMHRDGSGRRGGAHGTAVQRLAEARQNRTAAHAATA